MGWFMYNLTYSVKVTSTLYSSSSQRNAPADFPVGKNSRYPLHKRLCGYHCFCRHCLKLNSPLQPPEEPRIPCQPGQLIFPRNTQKTQLHESSHDTFTSYLWGTRWTRIWPRDIPSRNQARLWPHSYCCLSLGLDRDDSLTLSLYPRNRPCRPVRFVRYYGSHAV
jgi:hypothetical protein